MYEVVHASMTGMEHVSKSAERLPENVRILELPEARYRIIYENHKYAHAVEEIGKPDAVATEQSFGFDFGNPEYSKATATYWDSPSERRMPLPSNAGNDTVATMKRHFETNDIPLYFIDIVDPDHYRSVALAALLGLGSAEIGLGYIGGIAAKDAIKKGKNISRRDVLKGLAGAGLAIKGGTHAAEFLPAATDAWSGKKHVGISELRKEVGNISETINPETHTLTVTFRNAILAHKLGEISKQMRTKTGHKPEIGVIVGSLHSGIEKMLAMDSEARIQYIQRIQSILRSLNVAPTISSVARIEYSQIKDRWITTAAYKDQRLKTLEQS